MKYIYKSKVKMFERCTDTLSVGAQKFCLYSYFHHRLDFFVTVFSFLLFISLLLFFFRFDKSLTDEEFIWHFVSVYIKTRNNIATVKDNQRWSDSLNWNSAVITNEFLNRDSSDLNYYIPYTYVFIVSLIHMYICRYILDGYIMFDHYFFLLYQQFFLLVLDKRWMFKILKL